MLYQNTSVMHRERMRLRVVGGVNAKQIGLGVTTGAVNYQHYIRGCS